MLTTSHITSRVHQHHRVAVVCRCCCCCYCLRVNGTIFLPFVAGREEQQSASELLRLRASLRLLLLLARDRVGGILGGIDHNVHDRDRDIQPLEPTTPT